MTCCQSVPYSPPLGCTGFGGIGGPFACAAEPVITDNFIEPLVPGTVVITVNSTSTLFRGQGIKVADSIYQIQEIINATQILAIRTGGLEYTAGTIIYAKDPVYGCYQYRVINVGAVSVDYTPLVTAANASLVPNSGVTVTTTVSGRWRQLGPSTFAAEAYFKGNTDATANTLLLSFPDIGIPITLSSALPAPIGTVYPVTLGVTLTPMVCRVTTVSGTRYVAISTVAGTAIGANTNVIVSVGWTFEVPYNG